LLVGALVAVAFGQLAAVLASLGAAALGTWVALGTMGATGTPLSLSTVTLPSILLALGCAYVMHVLTAARTLREPAAITAAIARVTRPIAISGLTTVIGFLAMSTVRIGAIRELATIGAIGVLSVLAAALTFAPAVLSLRPLGDRGGRLDWWIRGVLTRRLVSFAVERPRTILASWLVLGAVFGVGAANLKVETDIILWFPSGTPIRDSYEAIRARLSGITPMNVMIESEQGRAVTEPDVLAAVDALARHLEGLPEVGRALSVADPLGQIHAGFIGEADAELPDNRPLIEQYLVLLGSVPQLRDLISDDRMGANVLLRVDVNGSRQLLAVGDEVARWWREHGPADFSVQTTGIMYEFGRAEEEIAQGQLRGLGLAFAAIGVIFLALFRRPGPALAPFLPNALPLLMTYGFMGLVGIPLDAATVCIGSVALGIAVDDTVHVALGYRAARESGVHPQAALHLALHRVLPALMLTTIAIASGFAVLGLSEFTMVRHFGLVTAGMVVLCLLADATLLPVLLLAMEPKRSASTPPS
jgi:predicted RND superfamily exporter protein